MNRLFVGYDHAAFDLVEELIPFWGNYDFKVEKYGPMQMHQSFDYPDAAQFVMRSVGEKDWGFLACGSGIGMTIAANRACNIRAALCLNQEMAELSRQHNNANVLVVGARFVDFKTVKQMFDIFVNTQFQGQRHQRRVDKIQNFLQ